MEKRFDFLFVIGFAAWFVVQRYDIQLWQIGLLIVVSLVVLVTVKFKPKKKVLLKRDIPVMAWQVKRKMKHDAS